MSTPFDVLSRLITVRDLSRRLLGRYDVDDSVADVWMWWSEESDDRGEDPMNQIALATDQGHVTGWLGFDMLMAEKTIGQCAEPIAHEAFLAAGTSVIEAVTAFATSDLPFFLVLEGNSITGWLGYNDLYKLPFRLCLFSLLLGIEQFACDLCKTQPGSSLRALTPGRLAKAKDAYRNRGLRYDAQGSEYEAELLDCTMFADKVRILRKLFAQTVPASKSHLFDLAEGIRNALAHPSDESALASKIKPEQLLPLIDWSAKIQRQMEQALGQGSTLPS